VRVNVSAYRRLIVLTKVSPMAIRRNKRHQPYSVHTASHLKSMAKINTDVFVPMCCSRMEPKSTINS
jgi:hypothetical protein